MHRLVFQRFVDDAHKQRDAVDQRNADMLYAVETFPEEAAELLFTQYVEPTRRQQQPHNDDSDGIMAVVEESDEDTCGGGSCCSSTRSPEVSPRKRKRGDISLVVSPGAGFQLMEGPNVVMFFDKEPRHHHIGYEHPVVIKRAATCRNMLEFEQVDVNGERLLQDCDRSTFFSALEAKGSGSFRNLIGIIAKHSEIADIASYSLVCKSWNASLSTNKDLWAHHYARLTNRLCGLGNAPSLPATTTRSMRRACLFASLTNMDVTNKRHMHIVRYYFRHKVSTGLWSYMMPRMVALIAPQGKAVTSVHYGEAGSSEYIYVLDANKFSYTCRWEKSRPTVCVYSRSHGEKKVSFKHIVETYVRWIEGKSPSSSTPNKVG
jgi:hypothetical protein